MDVSYSYTIVLQLGTISVIGFTLSTSRTKLLEAQSQQAEFKQKELSQVPFPIYIG